MAAVAEASTAVGAADSMAAGAAAVFMEVAVPLTLAAASAAGARVIHAAMVAEARHIHAAATVAEVRHTRAAPLHIRVAAMAARARRIREEARPIRVAAANMVPARVATPTVQIVMAPGTRLEIPVTVSLVRRARAASAMVARLPRHVTPAAAQATALGIPSEIPAAAPAVRLPRATLAVPAPHRPRAALAAALPTAEHSIPLQMPDARAQARQGPEDRRSPPRTLAVPGLADRRLAPHDSAAQPAWGHRASAAEILAETAPSADAVTTLAAGAVLADAAAGGAAMDGAVEAGVATAGADLGVLAGAGAGSASV